ncbi:MAG: hypothetical protein B6I31_03420 [Desulfobacteraceae bacterium 4572_19]|nr:MAG: hypothetical protein B6I31_03420 [Desulfobacteraceae bacterium 4572_19]
MARKFQNLKIYKLSYTFLLNIYKILPLLPESETRNIYSQLQRAATSIVLNIVEGCANRSNKVFLNHLQYSYGSCKEVNVLLLLINDLNYISEDSSQSLLMGLDELTANLYRFMQAIEKEIGGYKVNYTI